MQKGTPSPREEKGDGCGVVEYLLVEWASVSHSRSEVESPQQLGEGLVLLRISRQTGRQCSLVSGISSLVCKGG